MFGFKKTDAIKHKPFFYVLRKTTGGDSNRSLLLAVQDGKLKCIGDATQAGKLGLCHAADADYFINRANIINARSDPLSGSLLSDTSSGDVLNDMFPIKYVDLITKPYFYALKNDKYDRPDTGKLMAYQDGKNYCVGMVPEADMIPGDTKCFIANIDQYVDRAQIINARNDPLSGSLISDYEKGVLIGV